MRVLLLTIDAWRASHASFLPGAERASTPNLAAFAEEATVFPRAFSHAPATPYAFPALLTSTYPLDHGGYERLDESRILISEALADAGWHCVGVHSNPWLGAKYSYDRGYDEYRDVGEFDLPGLDRGRELLVNRFGLGHPVYRVVQSLYRRAQPVLRAAGGGRADEVRVAREALANGRSNSESDTFVWAHLLTPHAPYVPPERHREAVGVDDIDATELVTRAQRGPSGLSADERAAVEELYAASVRHADEQAGEILERVDEDTLVIVTADHGEALFEHETVGHPPRLYDELVHVPLLVRPPAGVSSGEVPLGETSSGSVSKQSQASPTVVEEVVRHVDVAPTILDYAGVPAPSSYRGRSLRPAIEGEGIPSELAVLEVASTDERPGQLDPDALRVGVRSASRKLVRADGALRGYDLCADPGECDPIEGPTGESWTRLRSALNERHDEISLEGSDASFDTETEERLRDLGYLE